MIWPPERPCTPRCTTAAASPSLLLPRARQWARSSTRQPLSRAHEGAPCTAATRSPVVHRAAAPTKAELGSCSCEAVSGSSARAGPPDSAPPLQSECWPALKVPAQHAAARHATPPDAQLSFCSRAALTRTRSSRRGSLRCSEREERRRREARARAQRRAGLPPRHGGRSAYLERCLIFRRLRLRRRILFFLHCGGGQGGEQDKVSGRSRRSVIRRRCEALRGSPWRAWCVMARREDEARGGEAMK